MGVNADEESTIKGAPGSTEFQQSRPQSRQTKIGVRNLNSVISRPFAKNAINESLKKVIAEFNALNESEIQATEPNVRILAIDNKQTHTALSAIAVCYGATDQSQEYVAVHTILLEDRATQLPNRTIQIANQNVDVLPTAGDVADPEMKSRVISIVKESFSRPTTKILDAGANVIYSEIDMDDKQSLRAVFGNAIQAAYNCLVANGIFVEPPFNADLIGTGDALLARMSYSPDPSFNTSGLPIRSDLSVTLQGVVKGTSQSQIEQVIPISIAEGFIDLVYTPPAQQQSLYQAPGFANAQQDTRRYTPRLVVTNFGSLLDSTSMEQQLLALASLSLLTDSGNNVAPWMNTFKPRPQGNKDEPDTRDIGAVGLEIKLTTSEKPAIIDTKSNKFGIQDLYSLLSMTIYPNLIFSIDIDEVGDLSYLNLAFLAAANGNRDAIEYIVGAANNLTNGAFSRNFDHNAEAMFFDDNNQVMTGYYKSTSGERRDIRDIDYLAILNLACRKNTDFITDWSDTFDRSDIPMAIRLEKRRRIYDQLLPGNVSIKGYARRITANPKFIVALAHSCKEGRLSFQPSNLNQDFMTVGEHGIAGAQNLGVAANRSGLFNHGSTGNNYNGPGLGMPGFGFGVGRRS